MPASGPPPGADRSGDGWTSARIALLISAMVLALLVGLLLGYLAGNSNSEGSTTTIVSSSGSEASTVTESVTSTVTDTTTETTTDHDDRDGAGHLDLSLVVLDFGNDRRRRVGRDGVSRDPLVAGEAALQLLDHAVLGNDDDGR